MAEECRYTIVGRFDRIRSQFKEMIKLKGSAQIGVFNSNNVVIKLKNEDDLKTVWFRRVMEIDGQQMWLQKWSSDFKPKEDLPVALAWVLLPQLPFHLHTWHYIKHLMKSIGTPLALDSATSSCTRPSMAKIKVEVNLMKTLPEQVWIGLEDSNAPLRGFYQKLEYEGVPKYCRHCRKISHYMMECRTIDRKNNPLDVITRVQETMEPHGAPNIEKQRDEEEEKKQNNTVEEKETIPGDMYNKNEEKQPETVQQREKNIAVT
ncbi:uncharacterized protein LOC132032129 [Lycium ferocissimum]|uniref:uncharacterized protein LOC132032129 n=1 Tax=Lycium ferocissimum TaxID=112874 RepID=UPI002815766B|nr:uncharacterized protein LOC132032129 [Lycium ferocissimum]